MIVSVIENFIEKAVMSDRGATEDGKYKEMVETINLFMEKIDGSAEKNPLSKFALAYPIGRPSNKRISSSKAGLFESFASLHRIKSKNSC